VAIFRTITARHGSLLPSGLMLTLATLEVKSVMSHNTFSNIFRRQKCGIFKQNGCWWNILEYFRNRHMKVCLNSPSIALRTISVLCSVIKKLSRL